LKRFLWLLLRLGISSVLLWFLLRRISLAELVEFFARTVGNWPWLLAALALPVVGLLISSLRLQHLLRAQRLDASLGELSMLHLVSAFYNQILPSTIGADVYRTYWISRIRSIDNETATNTGRILVATTVIGVDRVLGAVGLVATALLATAFDPSVVRASAGLQAILPLITIGAALVMLLPFIPSRKAGRWLFSIPLLNRVRDKAATVFGALKAYRRSLGSLLAALALSIALQLTIIGQFWLLSNALQLDVSFRGLAVLIPVVTMISMIPITINGIGLRENALRTLGVALGFTAASAIALGWAFVIIKTLWALAGGLVQLRWNRLPAGVGAASGRDS
jgi:uncharacterized protein (TIRG00374 family)